MPGPGLVSLTILLIYLAAGCNAVLPVQKIPPSSNFRDTGPSQIFSNKAHRKLERGRQKGINRHVQTNHPAQTLAFFVQGGVMRMDIGSLYLALELRKVFL